MGRVRVGLFRWKHKEDAAWALPKPAKDLMPSGTAKDALSSNGFFRLTFDRFPLDCATAPADVHVAVVERSRRNVLLLSGGDPNAPSSVFTGGFSVRVPDTFEAAVSGFRVLVKVSAKAAHGLADAEFSVAYSTADVGNSGWQAMSVGKDFETFSFEWDVPTMINGNGDYIGILPGQVGAIEVAGLAAFAIART